MVTIAGSSSTTIMVLLVAGKCEFITNLISSRRLVAKNVPTWFYPASGASPCKSTSFNENGRGKINVKLVGRRGSPHIETAVSNWHEGKFAGKGLVGHYSPSPECPARERGELHFCKPIRIFQQRWRLRIWSLQRGQGIVISLR